jgi:hypothetical protein
VQWWHFGLLTGIALAFFALSLWAFERRDISAGGGADVDVMAELRRLFGGHREADRPAA